MAAFRRYTQVAVHLKLARRGSGYARRFISIMAGLSLCTLLPLFVPQMEGDAVLSFEIGLLFAVVAFQLLISSFLPVTSTTTAIDQCAQLSTNHPRRRALPADAAPMRHSNPQSIRYAAFLFAYVFAAMVGITVVAFVGSDEHKLWLAAVLIGFWALFHIYYAWVVVQILRKEKAGLQKPIDKMGQSYVVRQGAARGAVAIAEPRVR